MQAIESGRVQMAGHRRLQSLVHVYTILPAASMKLGKWTILLAISGLAMAKEDPSWVRRLAFWAGPEMESLDRGLAGIDRGIAIEIVDDGHGFDPEGVQGGHGLTNLRKRAAGLGAAWS